MSVYVNAKLEYYISNTHTVLPSSRTEPEISVARSLPWTYSRECLMKTTTARDRSIVLLTCLKRKLDYIQRIPCWWYFCHIF
jgi:hypothetical protein